MPSHYRQNAAGNVPVRIKSPNTGDHYNVERKLGKGVFGTVHLVTNLNDKHKYVIKCIPIASCNARARDDAKQEVEVLKLNISARHPNIIKYYDSWLTGDELCIIMEHAPNGTLAMRIQAKVEERERFSQLEVQSVTQQLLSALACCHHTLRVIHRDIKPENILMDRYGGVKLADFGISKQIRDINALCATQAGTPLYMPPEMHEGRKYTMKADVWMLGCVLYEIMNLRPVWLTVGSPNTMEQLSHMIRTAKVNIESLKAFYSRNLCHLLLWMLDKNPERRPSMNDALKLFDMQAPPDEVSDMYKTAASIIQHKFRRTRTETPGLAKLMAAPYTPSPVVRRPPTPIAHLGLTTDAEGDADEAVDVVDHPSSALNQYSPVVAPPSAIHGHKVHDVKPLLAAAGRPSATPMFPPIRQRAAEPSYEELYQHRVHHPHRAAAHRHHAPAPIVPTPSAAQKIQRAFRNSLNRRVHSEGHARAPLPPGGRNHRQGSQASPPVRISQASVPTTTPRVSDRIHQLAQPRRVPVMSEYEEQQQIRRPVSRLVVNRPRHAWS